MCVHHPFCAATNQAPLAPSLFLCFSYEVELFQDGDSTGVRPFQASSLFVAGQVGCSV